MEPDIDDGSPVTDKVAADGQPVDEQDEQGESKKVRRFLCFFMYWPEERVYEEVLTARFTTEPRKAIFPTNVRLSRDVVRRMKVKSGKFETEVMDFATPLGLEIGMTSRLEPSAPPSTEGTDGLRLLFSYKLRGRKYIDSLPPEDLPPEVLQLIADSVRTDRSYVTNRTYLRWYWMYAASVRDRVVSREIAKQFPDEVPAEEPRPSAEDPHQ